MFRKSLVLAMLVAAFAVSISASNFRGADQVYVPVAGHLTGGGGSVLFVSDLFVSNLSDSDSVAVSVIYAPIGANPSIENFTNLFTLAPKERREFSDFFLIPVAQGGLGKTAAFGMLIFNACKANSDCTPDANGTNVNFRPISVESRIYSFPATGSPTTSPTNGQDFAGHPWFSFVSSDAASAGLDKVFITGIRNTGTTGAVGTFRTNIGLINASQFSTTTLLVKLFDGKTGAQIGSTFSQTLGPLGNTQANVAAMFSAFAAGASATNAYVSVEQTNTTPTSDAAANGCSNGCPAFFAYGSQLDNSTQDATTLESQFSKQLTDVQINCLFSTGTTCKTTPTIRRAVKH